MTSREYEYTTREYPRSSRRTSHSPYVTPHIKNSSGKYFQYEPANLYYSYDGPSEPRSRGDEPPRTPSRQPGRDSRTSSYDIPYDIPSRPAPSSSRRESGQYGASPRVSTRPRTPPPEVRAIEPYAIHIKEGVITISDPNASVTGKANTLWPEVETRWTLSNNTPSEDAEHLKEALADLEMNFPCGRSQAEHVAVMYACSNLHYRRSDAFSLPFTTTKYLNDKGEPALRRLYVTRSGTGVSGSTWRFADRVTGKEEDEHTVRTTVSGQQLAQRDCHLITHTQLGREMMNTWNKRFRARVAQSPATLKLSGEWQVEYK